MDLLARRLAPAIFALALFSSAALIFVLQPLFTRMTMPLLGGSPAVWNASMAFFQAALLLGYLYAHLLARLKDLRLQAGLHAGVLALAALALPLRVSGVFGPPNYEHPALWLIGVLAVSVGAPFAAASATAPLLQAWYARSGRADARDPYYLYAASNLGSFAGLLAYPALIEPLLGTRAQSAAWQSGYALITVLILAAAVTALLAKGPPGDLAGEKAASPPPGWARRLYWLGAAAVPSALVPGVTLQISTNIGSAPLFWVVPLALYLVTYIIAFSRGAERIAPLARLIYPFSLFFLIGSYLLPGQWVPVLSGNLFGFFMSALLCHLALARARPGADRLTEFYLFVSLGGVLGGAAAALLAPVIFNNDYEYPLALAAAALFLPRGTAGLPRLAACAAAAAAMMGLVLILLRWLQPGYAVMLACAAAAAAALAAEDWFREDRPPLPRFARLLSAAALAAFLIYAALPENYGFLSHVKALLIPAGVRVPRELLLSAASLLALLYVIRTAAQPGRRSSIFTKAALTLVLTGALLLFALRVLNERLAQDTLVLTGLGICLAAIFLNRARPRVLTALVLVSFLIFFLKEDRVGRIITQERGFFGILRTREIPDPGDPRRPLLRILMHCGVVHGAQLRTPGLTRQPLTYYNPRTALGEAVLAGLSTGEPSRVALIGLGAGSTACLIRRTDRLTIFEIDPAVVRLAARPGGDFTYVQECQPDARVVLGDARLKIAGEPDGAFDVIVVDAFSADAIPAHLLTREAMELYLRKTSDHGIVVLHLSNSSLALISEAARVARDIGAPALFRVSKLFRHPYASYFGGLGAGAMIVVKSTQVLDRLPLSAMPEWSFIESPGGRAWSDDYINIPRALLKSLTGEDYRLKKL
ncbi:MAG: fused MFS/spermidine synthase [Elusimicrobiota bacterium]|nr:fused MFS/spermidine synthase [Elusimicrobiota bacterium]